MAANLKKELGEVKEQEGSKQKVAPKEQKEKKSQEYEEKGSTRFQHKSGTESRLKNEAAEYHSTSLDHPAAQYETYKRPRRDS